MRVPTTTIIIALFPFLGLSQQQNSEDEGWIEIKTSSNELLVKETSTNAVSPSITVHTVKYANGPIINKQQNDSEVQSVNSTKINGIVDRFLAVQGVSRCTFDSATQTFTILTEPAVDLSAVLGEINTK